MTFLNPEPVSLRQWGVYRKVAGAVASGAYGELCSLRWSWLSPGGDAALLYSGVLAHLLEASRELAGGRLERLHLEPAETVPACFALAAFEGGVVAEVEIHEALPPSAPAVRFLLADFTGGRVTNRPLVGHHHGEGAFLATGEGAEALLFEPMPAVKRPLEDGEIQRMIAAALGGGRGA